MLNPLGMEHVWYNLNGKDSRRDSLPIINLPKFKVTAIVWRMIVTINLQVLICKVQEKNYVINYVINIHHSQNKAVSTRYVIKIVKKNIRGQQRQLV